jgi:hypothetical protein
VANLPRQVAILSYIRCRIAGALYQNYSSIKNAQRERSFNINTRANRMMLSPNMMVDELGNSIIFFGEIQFVDIRDT